MEGQPLPIIDAPFCAPHPVQIIITRKAPERKRRRGFKLTALDTNGNLMFKMDRSRNLRHRTKLIDASGHILLTIQKRLFNPYHAYQVFKGDSTSKDDLLFTVRKSSLFQIMRTELLVFLATNTSKFCDFKIKGSYKRRRSLKIYKGDSSTVVAQISKEQQIGSVQLMKDDFVMDINPDIDSAFIAALIVIRREFLIKKIKSVITTGPLLIACGGAQFCC